MGAVELLHPLDPGTVTGDGDRGGAQLEAREGAPEAPPGELSEQRPVAAADVEDGVRSQPHTGTQLDHVVGLPDRTQGPPAGVQLGLLGGARVGLLVEGGEGLGVVTFIVRYLPREVVWTYAPAVVLDAGRDRRRDARGNGHRDHQARLTAGPRESPGGNGHPASFGPPGGDMIRRPAVSGRSRVTPRRIMFKSIVVGTDGSETATQAVRQAVDLAKAVGASVELVSAYEPVSNRACERAP